MKGQTAKRKIGFSFFFLQFYFLLTLVLLLDPAV